MYQNIWCEKRGGNQVEVHLWDDTAGYQNFIFKNYAYVHNGKSLLAAGIKKVVGRFNKGDHIKILDNKKKEFARGLSSFSSKEINLIIGCHSNEIQKILGYVSKSEVVHKDDMVEI